MSDVPMLLGGRYEVGDLLGRGGMAEVHLGFDTRLGRPVALKMLRSELARDQTFISRFRREAQSAAGLNHASIVAVYDHGEDVLRESGGAEVKVPFIVMEHVDGRTLREVLTERGSLPTAEAFRITEGVLDALAYSHRNGIVHRDIKPANVMIAGDGTVKVMDFGIARAMADANATMTQTQAVIGTAQYLSPEQAQGQSVDARSDLYSTGCMLFELLTGRPPFVGDSPVAIAYQHVGESPTPPSRVIDGLTEDVDSVVLHALAKPRDARYQSADEFRHDLAAVRLGRPISDAARGAAAALAGAAAGGLLAGTSTEALPPMRDDSTSIYSATPRPVPAYDARHGSDDTYPGDDDGYDERRRNPAAMVLLVLAVLAALGALGYGMVQYLGDPDIVQVTVPRLVGDPEESAVAKLGLAKLKADVVRETSDTVEDGLVIRQNPGDGTEVDEGSRVQLVVSSGPSAVTVPDVSGKTLKEATGILTDLGLKVGEPDRVNDPDTAKDEVIDSNPSRGTSVALNTTIILRVGTGEVEVPNVVGRTRDQAQQAIQGAGLKYKTQTRETDSVPEDTVIEQNPQDGTLEIGKTVTIVVAKKPAPTPTPTPTPTPSESPSPSPTPSLP
ncbi:Stk1 family PASTA domain-containing Ser/Thr kinase [Oryzobacter telluris]|uniref:Stk1 family PASTA domain-containing Ser/Thr kinase n=1 Tax=Oryzobacter telluris TaxID=3149179 RepID=UPI00370DBD4D